MSEEQGQAPEAPAVETPAEPQAAPLSEEQKLQKIDELLQGGEADPFLNQGLTDISPPQDEIDASRERLGITEAEDSEEAEKPVEAETEAPAGGDEKPTEIDYDMSIPMPDGREAMTLGEMKDRLTQFERNERQTIDRENKVYAEQQQLNAMIQEMGGIPEQFKERAQQLREQHLTREYQSMVEMIPEMGTREGFERITGQVRNELEQAGFSPQEIASISSANVVRYVVNNIRLKESMETAGLEAKKVREKPRKPTPKKRRQESNRVNTRRMVERARGGSETDKLTAIDHLLRHGT